MIDRASELAAQGVPVTSGDFEAGEVTVQTGQLPEQPAGNASKDEWLDWAKAHGMPRDIADQSFTRDQLREIAADLESGRITVTVEGEIMEAGE